MKPLFDSERWADLISKLPPRTTASPEVELQDLERWRLRADASGVPREVGMRDVILRSNPEPTLSLQAYQQALEWRVQNSSREGSHGVLFVVSGPPGTGKSCAMAWCLTRASRAAVYVSAATVAATPRNGWSTNEEAWDRWLTVDLLCIDEAGGEKGDPMPLAFLFAERYNRGLATLVACNLARRDFQQRYPDERLGDRLVNGQGRGGDPNGLPWFVAVTGNSMRGLRSLRPANDIARSKVQL